MFRIVTVAKHRSCDFLNWNTPLCHVRLDFSLMSQPSGRKPFASTFVPFLLLLDSSQHPEREMSLSYNELGMYFSKVHFSWNFKWCALCRCTKGRWLKWSLWWWFQWAAYWKAAVNVRHYYSTLMLQWQELVRGNIFFPNISSPLKKVKIPNVLCMQRWHQHQCNCELLPIPSLWKQCHGALTCFAVYSACLWSIVIMHLFHNALFSQLVLFQLEIS